MPAERKTKSKSKIKSKTIRKSKKMLSKNFLVVAIGASAGGLDAISEFFKNMPAGNNIAFIIITHLERTHASILPQIISKYTSIPVQPIKNNLQLKPGNIYINIPNKNVYVKQGMFHLIAPSKIHSFNFPINMLFESIAEEYKNNAVGLILSGTGIDGTASIDKLKQLGGVIIAQDPFTAKYDDMPQNAINTGLVDYILPPEAMPAQLIKCLRFDFLDHGKITPELQKIFSMLKTHTGHDFSSYKLNTIYRRIERQMHRQNISAISDYVHFLQLHPQEISNLLKDLLIGVTTFFRDAPAFEILKNDILPKFLKNNAEDYIFRVWIPGCSTGEEVYSIAIIIKECMEELKQYYRVQIFATDIDIVALEIARRGTYSEQKCLNVSEERLKRFFIKEKHNYTIKKEIREMVIFSAHNIIKDPPFTKLDMICCRNLLIYLNAQMQRRLFPLFHYSLKPKGILFLGTSEFITESVNLFRLIVKNWKIFEKKNANITHIDFLDFPSHTHITKENPVIPTLTTHSLMEEKSEIILGIKKYLLEHYGPPCLVVNKKGNVIYIHGKINHYLEADLLNHKSNLFEVISPAIQSKLKAGMRDAYLHKKEIIYHNLKLKRGDKVNLINLRIIPIENLKNLLIIIFEDVFTSQQKKAVLNKYGNLTQMGKRILELERELQFTHEILQSAMEELQSTNEELQSTNEEIETSKEELQSLNEELVVTNAELQNQVDQLVSLNDDMNNLFNSTEICAIFLDNDLKVKRFTPKVLELIPLIQADIGRSITHFATNIKYEHLVTDAKKVLKTLAAKSVEVESKDKKWFLIRIIPYRTLSNTVDGLVITFTDITLHYIAKEKAEECDLCLQRSSKMLKDIFNVISEPLVILNKDFLISSANRAYYHFFQSTASDTINQSFYTVNQECFNIVKLQKLLTQGIEEDQFSETFHLEHDLSSIPKKELKLHIKHIQNAEDEPLLFIGIETMQ